MTNKTLNPNQLNETDRALFEETVSKDINDLTEYDVAFLRARVAYLNADQREYFDSVFKGKVKGADSVEEVTAVNPDKLNHATLLKMAQDAGLDVKEEMTKKELADALNAR